MRNSARRGWRSQCGRCGSENVSCYDCARLAFPKPRRQVCSEYLDYLRTQPCVSCGARRGIEASHLITRGAMGGDFGAVSQCHACHAELHSLGLAGDGLRKFEDRHGVNLWACATRQLAAFAFGASLREGGW